MSGRSGEVVDTLVRSKVYVCCVQETRWKSDGARMLNGKSCRYKFLLQNCSEGLHGVEVLLSEDLVDKVVEVKRISECLMLVKMILGLRLANVI